MSLDNFSTWNASPSHLWSYIREGKTECIIIRFGGRFRAPPHTSLTQTCENISSFLQFHIWLLTNSLWFSESVLPIIHHLLAVKMSSLISEYICSSKQQYVYVCCPFVRNAPSLFCIWKISTHVQKLCRLFRSFFCSLTHMLRPSSGALTNVCCKALSFIAFLT